MTDRFYPDSIPPFYGEPTKQDFSIDEVSNRVGVGVKAKRNFRRGDALFSFRGDIVSELTQYSLRIFDGVYLDDPHFMGRVLHRCEPNAHADMTTKTFYALRDISAGEWVTMDYRQTESVLYKDFVCNCGPLKCAAASQGLIQGSGETDEQRALRLFSDCDWHFAKTLAHIPHHYTRRREWGKEDDFTWICEYINRNAKQESFKETGNYVYNYLYLGDYKYWVMERDKRPSQQILINRADPKLEY